MPPAAGLSPPTGPGSAAVTELVDALIAGQTPRAARRPGAVPAYRTLAADCQSVGAAHDELVGLVARSSSPA